MIPAVSRTTALTVIPNGLDAITVLNMRCMPVHILVALDAPEVAVALRIVEAVSAWRAVVFVKRLLVTFQMLFINPPPMALVNAFAPDNNCPNPPAIDRLTCTYFNAPCVALNNMILKSSKTVVFQFEV